MDEIQENQQPISDDQDLAKALAGLSEGENVEEMDFAGAIPSSTNIQNQIAISDDSTAETLPEVENIETPIQEITPEPEMAVPEILPEPEIVPEAPDAQQHDIDLSTTPSIEDNSIPISTVDTSSLDAVVSQAVQELRPLVGKLELPPEEKFETYLLLIRSTDDKELIAPAYEAAKQITDEAKRAEALLDIIKEAEYLKEEA